VYKPNYHITDGLLNIIAQIEAVRSKVSTSYILPEREIEMRYRATVEATHSSTSIEGNPLNLKQVAKVLSDKTPLTRHQYAEIEVKNYKKAIDFINKRKQAGGKMKTQDVLAVHKIVTAGLLAEEKVGNWRKNPVYIENHQEKVLYTAPAARNVRREVEQLLEWLATKSADVHPVIAAAIFHLQFVSIHPFADGNGRSTRILTMLYLSLRAYDFRSALVLDSYYSTDKKAYYNALHSVQGDNYFTAASADLNPWIKYFAEGFLVSANVLAAEVTLLSSAVKDLQFSQKISRDETDILSYIKQFGAVTISEAEQILPGIPRRTVQRKLKNLVDNGLVKLDGATHEAKYTLKVSTKNFTT
jgi:Fic family protein